MSLHNPILDKARDQEKVVKPATAIPSDAASVPVPKASSKLQAVEEALTKSTARITSSIAELEAKAKQTTLATDVITSAISDITSATQITASASNTADLQAQNATISAFEASGGTEIQATLIAQLTEDGDRVADLLDEKADIVDDEHTGIQLIDNIINSFRSSQLNLEINAAQAQENQTVRQISNISAATESFARVNQLTKKTLNEGVIEANYSAIEAEGAIKRAEAELKNIHSNATAMNNMMAADSRNVNALLSVFRLEGEVESRKLSQERAIFARERMELDRKKMELELPAAELRLKREKLALEQATKIGPTQRAQAEVNLAKTTKVFNDLVATQNTIVEGVQQAQSLAGIPIEDKETILFGFTRTGATKAKYDRLLELGSSVDLVLGQTPFESKLSLGLISPSGNITPTKGTAMLEQINTLQAAKYKKTGVTIPKDLATLEADFNQTAKEAVAIFQANIQTGDTSNPYHAPPMSVLEQAISVQNSSLYQLVLKPKNMKETNPQTILDAAVAGVTAKTITPEQAATGITVLFEAAALYNNTLQGGFRRVGLPNQTTYNTQLKVPASIVEQLKLAGPKALVFPSVAIVDTIRRSLGGKALDISLPVDLMDRTRVQEAIIKMLSVASTIPAEKKEGDTNTAHGEGE